MAGEGIACQHFRPAPHIHRRRVEIVHAVLDGVVYEAVDLILVIWQAHHAEAEQGDLIARTVLHAVGHTILYAFLVLSGQCVQWLHCHQSHG